MKSTAEGLLHVPFGALSEKRTSIRYLWDNRLRGTDPFVIVQCTLHGNGIFALNGKSHRVPPGHTFVAIVPEDSRYHYPSETREPWVFSWINFYGDLAIQLWTSLRNQAGPVIPLQPTALRMLRNLIARVSKAKRAEPYETSRMAYEFYLETLRHLPRPRETKPFQDVIAYFQAHYQEGLRMKEIAAHAGMSREHFTRLFNRQIGCAPAAFLRRIRLEAAARLLRTTDLPIGEAAFRCGWSSASKLDLFFKRHYGVSPREYRKRRRGSRFK